MCGRSIIGRNWRRILVRASLPAMLFFVRGWSEPVPAAPVAPTVFVSWDGSGAYNCDGTADEIEINAALTFVTGHAGFTTVHLKGPHIYIIGNSVKIGSNTTLTGDATAVIKLMDAANWPKLVPLVTATATSGIHDVTVRGFEIDGNDTANYTGGRNRGQDYYNALAFKGVTNLNVHNMYIHDNMNDGMKISSCANVNYHDNRILRHGHDGLYAYKSYYINAYNNAIAIRTNCGIRFSDSNHCKAYNNTISRNTGGGCGIEIEHSLNSIVMNDIDLFNNIIYGTATQGVWMFAAVAGAYAPTVACNVKIHNNIFYNCGGGINISGWFNTLIENNVIDGCGTYGIDATGSPPFLPPSGMTGFSATVRNNIICNNSAGIANTLHATHTIDSSHNCFFQNSSGNITGRNVNSSDDLLNVDPLFYNRADRNYHLKSKYGRWDPVGKIWVKDSVNSPCIDAGYWLSSYSHEPSANGWRIDIGAYGNTAEASKSLFTGAKKTWPYWQ